MRCISNEYAAVKQAMYDKYPQYQDQINTIQSKMIFEQMIPTIDEFTCILFSRNSNIAMEYAFAMARKEKIYL